MISSSFGVNRFDKQAQQKQPTELVAARAGFKGVYAEICADFQLRGASFRAVLANPEYAWSLAREGKVIATLMELAGCGIFDLDKLGLPPGLVDPILPTFTAIVPPTPVPEAKRLRLSTPDPTRLPSHCGSWDFTALGTKVPPWAGTGMSLEVAAVVEHLLLSYSTLANLDSRVDKPRKEWEREVWSSTTGVLHDCVLVSPLFSVTANHAGLTPADLASCVDHFDRCKGRNTRASANRTAMGANIAAIKSSFASGLPPQVQALFTGDRTIINWFCKKEEAGAYDEAVACDAEEAKSIVSGLDCGFVYVSGVDYWGLGEARDFPCRLTEKKEIWGALRLKRGRALALKQEKRLVRVIVCAASNYFHAFHFQAACFPHAPFLPCKCSCRCGRALRPSWSSCRSQNRGSFRTPSTGQHGFPTRRQSSFANCGSMEASARKGLMSCLLCASP